MTASFISGRATYLLALVLVLGTYLSLLACSEAGSPTEPKLLPAASEPAQLAGEPATTEAGATLAASGEAIGGIEPEAVRAKACSLPKVRICHVPPGNPDKVRELCIAARSEPDHLAHGDHLPLTFWPDLDGDGFGAGAAATGCELPAGFVQNNDDCDDSNPAIHPDAVELCDGLDNDCDGGVDEGGVCGQGCTPGYWKNHTDSWRPTNYSPGQLVQSVFSQAAAYPPLGSATFLQALDFGGGPGVEGAARLLLRAAVAGLLNAAHPDISYPRSEGALIEDVNAALASGDEDTILALAASTSEDNNAGCPLN